MDKEVAEHVNPNAIIEVAPSWPIEVRPNGTVIYDGMAIGGLDLDDELAPRLTLNLGWLRLAGVGLRVQDDPAVDHHRDGLVLER